MDEEMTRALEADGEKLQQITGEDHGPWRTWNGAVLDAGERDVDPVFTPPTDAELKTLARKTADFIREIDPFGDRFSQREVFFVEVMIEGNPVVETERQSYP